MAFVIAFLICLLVLNINYRLKQILFELRLNNQMKSNVTMAKLKPCHFETGERLPGIVKRPDFPNGYKYQVVWESEDQEIIICTRLFETRRQAIDAWNKRS